MPAAGNYWKTTFIFNAGKQGWGETYYFSGSADPKSPNMISFLKTFAQKRDTLCGRGVAIEAIKWTIEKSAGLGHTLDYTDQLGGITGQVGVTTHMADQAGACLELAFRAEDGGRRTAYLRGIPDRYIERDDDINVFKLTPEGRDKAVAFISYLEGVKWIYNKAKKKLGEVASETTVIANPISKIEVSSDAQGSAYELTLPGGTADLNVGDRVQIKGCRGINVSRVNGLHTIIAKDATAGTLEIEQAPDARIGIYYTGKGQLGKLDYWYPQVTSFLRGRVHFRRTGRAFFVPRGRRPARK